MTVFEATPQYEPAERQSWLLSGDSCMRAQNMVRAPIELKSPISTTPPRKDDPFLGVRFGAAPSKSIPPREPSPRKLASENTKSP
jgi:hypothetical protein